MQWSQCKLQDDTCNCGIWCLLAEKLLCERLDHKAATSFVAWLDSQWPTDEAQRATAIGGLRLECSAIVSSTRGGSASPIDYYRELLHDDDVHANDQAIDRAILASFASAKVEAEVAASTDGLAAAAARSDGVLTVAHAPAATTDDTAPTPDTTPTAIAVPSSASTLAAPSAPSGAAIQAAGYVIPDGARPGIAVPTLKYADD
jgi:hypothetical protein